MSVDGEVRRFRKDLKNIKAVSPDAIAMHMPHFSCSGCAKCCRAAFGDNTVTLFPDEIRVIMAATGLEWLDVAEPEEDGDTDGYGNSHAFEWALRKKPDGDCRFLEKGRCSIYESRPHICRTYPFYLDNNKVQGGECDGLGKGKMDNQDAGAMAKSLLDRHTKELEESIGLLEKLDMEAGRGHKGMVIVHDSEGTWLVAEKCGRRYFLGKGRS